MCKCESENDGGIEATLSAYWPPRVIDYQLLFDQGAVRQALGAGDGWELYGTPFADGEGGICQALVRYEVASAAADRDPLAGEDDHD